MSNASIDIDTLDVAKLSPAAVTTLGDSALGHAVRRMLECGAVGADPAAPAPIAAHESHV